MKTLRQTVAELMVAAHKIPMSLAEIHTSEMDEKQLSWRLNDYIRRGVADNSAWYPACGGTETEFKSRSGLRLLYCWQPSTGDHAYINLDTDIILSAEEAAHAMGLV